ncbi:hypothetical protein ACO2Q8_20970 [Larkinella sp. VNQ87]|uniref:hypothetical protein n=1 Tax=Larkinella sp. VNQ87 TaxID=3400921 RepID=UPI003C0E5CCB
MANNKTVDQPGSNDKQGNSKRTRDYEARDTSAMSTNMEKMRSNQDKTKQGPDEDHTDKTKSELQHERGGSGHSSHSGSRSGSDSGK